MHLSSPLFILCLCICFYACTARPLVADNDSVSGKVQKNVKKYAAESEGVTKGEGIKVKSIGGVKAPKRLKPTVEVHLNDAKKTKEEEELSGMGLARSEVSKFYHKGLFKATILKGSRRRAIPVVSPAKVKQNADAQ